ncbi:hypothetical protein [Roseibium sp.]|uniref:hypothetical protein n=1 Tax=Roseibium sp. TaxID=1936156 RepID=UPI003D0A9863
MSGQRNADIPASERAEIFHENFGNTLDGANTYEDIFIALARYLAVIGGEAASDKALATYLNEVFKAGLDESSQWKEFVERNAHDFFSENELGEIMHNLMAYAEYGIVLHPSTDRDTLAEHIKAMIERVDELWSLTPVTAWQLDDADQIGPLLTWAKGRWALDNNEPIEPAALAYLAGMAEQSVRNLMSKKKGGLYSEKGKVPAQDALEWLSTRPNFWDSIWQTQDMQGHYKPLEELTVETFVFVPVSRDGSIFHPGLKHDGGFRVGPRDAEQTMGQFEEALSYLQSLSKPYWRRKNANGQWALIAGVRWERLSETELKKFEDDPERRLQAAL